MRLGLRDVTAVVQDWGGPIGLRVATEMDDRFARLVILNTGIMSGQNRMSDAWWAFHDFVEKVKPDLPIGLLVARACAIEPATPRWWRPTRRPSRARLQVGRGGLPAAGAHVDRVAGAAEQMEVGTKLEQWQKPALVAFSDSDPIFTVRTGERFVKRIPGAGPLVVIEGAAHFLQEDKGEEVAANIVEFLHP